LNELEIKVMHWNILAQKLTGPDKFPNIDPNFMKWEFRSTLIKNHI
jgi:mRNA deadenylase 3'-5' endonuclease subunit Ccr4